MRTNDAKTSTDMPKPEVQRAPRKRFRFEKLEERIAPQKGGNTKHCSGSGTSGGLSSGSIY